MLMEAFKAGNRARKKESAADTVQSTGRTREEWIKYLEENIEGATFKIKKEWFEGKEVDMIVYDGPGIMNTGIEYLPPFFEVGSLTLSNCPNLKCLPDHLFVEGELYIDDCPLITELPKDMFIAGYKIYTNSEALTDFFQSIGIDMVDDWDGYEYDAEDFRKWQMKNGYYQYDVDEAFKTGNRARKKESVQDQTGETAGRQKTRYTRKDLDKSNISRAIAESLWKWCPEIFTPEFVNSPAWEDVDEWDGGNTISIDDLSQSGADVGYVPIGDSDLSVSGIWIYFNLGHYSDPSKKGTFFINAEVYDELTALTADLAGMGLKARGGYWESNQVQIGMKDMPDGLRETLDRVNRDIFGGYWGYEPNTADSSVLEAFRAGNQARKKEAVQDTAAITDLSPYTDIEGIRGIIDQYSEFPYTITDNDHPVRITISSKIGNVCKIQDLPFEWNLEMTQHLRGDTENGFTTDGNNIRLDLYIDGDSMSNSIVLTAEDVPYEKTPLTRAGFENLMKSLKSINDNAGKFFNSGYVSSFVHDMMCFWYEDFSILQKEYHSYPPAPAHIKVKMKNLISKMLGLMFISRMPGGDWQMIIKECGHKPANADEQSDILKGWMFKEYGEIRVLTKFMDGNAGDCTRAAREMYDWLLQKFGMMTRLPDWTVLENCGIISH